MDEIINIGILGCANIANRSVIPAILELKNLFKLIGVSSRSSNKARNFAEQFQTKPFDSYESLIEFSGINAIYIPLPNALHAEWIKKALDRGLHVLIEKSLAVKYLDVELLNELAKHKELVLLENFQFRFHSQLEYIKNLLDNRAIGDLRCVRSSFGFPGLQNEQDIRYQKSLGGGALLDAGAYPLKIAQILLGHEIEVKAANLNSTPGKEVDIWGGAYLKQINGNLFAEIAFGFDQYYQCNLELWGSEGRIYTNRIFTAGVNYEPLIELETKSIKETIMLPADNHFKNMLVHFHNLIHHKSNLDLEYKQNLNQARLIHEIKIKANE